MSNEKNYLQNKTDEISFLKVLFQQTNADGVVAAREQAFTHAIMEKLGISAATASEARDDFQANGLGNPVFSSSSAAVQALMTAGDLSAVDFDFSQAEVAEIIQMAEKLGLRQKDNTAVREKLVAYYNSLIEMNNGFEAVYSQITPTEAGVAADKIYVTDDDQKNYIKTLIRITCADGRIEAAEETFLQMMGRVFHLKPEMVQAAMEEAKTQPAGKITFSSELAARLTLRESIRLSCTDNDYDEAEKDTLMQLAQEMGIDLERSLLDKVSVLVKDRVKVAQLREAALDAWCKNV